MLRAKVVIVGFTFTLVSLGLAVLLPSISEARCAPSETVTTIDLGREGPQSYSCGDGNHTYLGWVSRNGYGADSYVRGLVNGVWATVSGKSYNESQQINYYFSDADGNAPLKIRNEGPGGPADSASLSNFGF